MKPVAASLFAGAALLLLAGGQRVNAAEPAVPPPLLPAQIPCETCGRPLAQATAAPQDLPAAPAPAARFRLNDLRLNGAQALSSDELKSVTQPYIGRDVSLGDLETLARAITGQYRARGYFLATAVVPVQTVRDGVVEISVIEGRLGKVDVLVAADAPLSEQRVRAFLAPLRPGEAVNAQSYERAMLLLSDQPGVRVSSGLQEGAQTGTTDLSVEVAASSRWAFTAEADNYGTLETGRNRLGGTARWLSPAGIGDNLDARIMVANNNATVFGRLAYEAPIGGSGLRAGVGLARVNYEVGGAFVDLQAQGVANVYDIALNYPVIRQRQHNLFVRLSADSKDLTDEYRAVGLTTKKRIQGVGLGWTWERRDDVLGGGYWASAGTLYRGDLSLKDADSLLVDQSEIGRRTEGGFTKLSFQVSRLQSIVERHSLYLSLGGQWANKNLDAYEKLSLGGARAVRAYPSGELLVDRGAIGTVEWRWSFNEQVTPFVFYDAAHGRIVLDPTPFDGASGQSLRGYGIGVSWAQAGNFAINATVAWRAGTAPAVTDGGGNNPRFFVQAQKVF